MLNRFKDLKHDWEHRHLEKSRETLFKNTFAGVEYILRTCAGKGTRFERECYDIGHLYNLPVFWMPAQSSHRSSYSRSLAFWAESARIRKT